jgi:hypothetical protein
MVIRVVVVVVDLLTTAVEALPAVTALSVEQAQKVVRKKRGVLLVVPRSDDTVV